MRCLSKTSDYLLNANEPWVVYRTMLDLMELKEKRPQSAKSQRTIA